MPRNPEANTQHVAGVRAVEPYPAQARIPLIGFP